MSDGFNNGLMGIPGGGANNAAGLIWHTAMQNNDGAQQPDNDGAQQPVVKKYACGPGFAVWEASQEECFQLSQRHVNYLEISVFVNVVLLLVVIIHAIFSRPKRRTKNDD